MMDTKPEQITKPSTRMTWDMVAAKVPAKGVCKGLEMAEIDISPKNGSLEEYYIPTFVKETNYGKQYEEGIRDQGMNGQMERMLMEREKMLPLLVNLTHNEYFLEERAVMGEETKVWKSTGTMDEHLRTRLELVVNSHVDPEVLMLVLEKWRCEGQIENLDSIRDNFELLSRLSARLGVIRDFPPYKAREIGLDVKKLFLDGENEEVAVIFGKVDAFDLSHSVDQEMSHLYGGYIEKFDYWLAEKAKAFERGKYLILLEERAKSIIKAVAPELYIDPDVREIIAFDPYDQDYDSRRKMEVELYASENGSWDSGTHTVCLISESQLGNSLRDILGEKIKYAVPFDGISNGKYLLAEREILDLITMIHELGHAMFDEMVNSKLNGRGGLDKISVYRAFTEGMAIALELASARAIKNDPLKYGFSADDNDTFNKVVMARGRALRKQKDTYTVGYVGMVYPMVNEWSSSVKGSDLNIGFKKMREMLGKLDGIKLNRVSIYNGDFRKIMMEKDWSELVEVFGREEVEVTV